MTINGNSWLSYSSALSAGFTTTNTVYSENAAYVPSVDSDTNAMLNSGIWCPACDVNFGMPVANGNYYVYLWSIENYQSNSHTCNVNLEGVQVAAGIGLLPLHSWARYGPYSVTVSDGTLNVNMQRVTGYTAVAGVELWAADTGTPSPTPTAPPSTLGNISTRLRVESGDNVLICGLIATGTGSKSVIIRAIGPTLSGFGIPGALADPILELYQGNTLLFSNDDWRNSSQHAEIVSTGFAPNNDAESAIIWTLTPGENYTAVVRGKNGQTGIGVVEAFDLDPAAASKLANISTRGFVEVDDNVMIAGLIVTPSSGASLNILARALGPTLGDIGVPDALANPTLELVNSSGTVIRSNDNWKDSQRAEIEATGLAPNHDEESALVEAIAPGAYTAIVRGNGRTTGVGLVEVYNIP